MHPFEEELTCSICYSLFEDPRVLSCSHTFCRSCLEGVVQASNSFSVWRIPLKCPNCRRVSEIAAAGVGSLPINFAVKAIIEKSRREEAACSATCRQHSSQPLNIYCLRDRKLVCGHCLTIGEHSGHPIDDLHAAYQKEKRTAGELLQQLTDKHWTDVCLLLEKLKEQKAQCESVVRGDQMAVVQYFRKLSDTLEDKKQALLTALEEAKAQVVVKYDPLIQHLEKMREEQLELMSLNTAVQKEESPLVFLEKMGDMQQRVKALREKQLPHVEPVEVHPRIGHLLKDVWSKIELGQIDKILAPKVKVVLKRKLRSRGGGRGQGREVKEHLQAVNRLVQLLLVITAVVGLSFYPPVSSLLFEAAPLYLSEVLLPACQGLHSRWQAMAVGLCDRFNLLMEFVGRVVSLQQFQ
ncbi:tripartite motif-containing protein 59 [Indicator indicator]|uniref:tripartite motif-containing protein 59 n=1 Tax=Indicator indicator TaxID=1002788 RepID=UPI0023DFFF76|nr:tripartite motif-containing protein 59 [Indicator indicator]